MELVTLPYGMVPDREELHCEQSHTNLGRDIFENFSSISYVRIALNLESQYC